MQTLPSLVAQKKRRRLRSLMPDDNISPSATESRLIDHGDNMNYGTEASQHCQNNNHSSSESAELCEPHHPEVAKGTKFRDAFTRPILMTLINYSFLAFLDMCYSVLLPLMYSTSIQFGGLGLDPSRIGAALGAFGLINSVVQLNFLGRVIRKYGPRNVYRTAFCSFFVLFSMYAITKFFAQRAGRVDEIVVVCMIFQLGCQMFIFASYGE